jgi:hypothetical protein
MTTAVATEADLDQVFDEVKHAQTDVDNRTRALQQAEQKSAAVRGLTAAAQNAQRTAEANLQLLNLAKDESESRSAEYTSISAQRDAVDTELKEAKALQTMVGKVKTAVSEIKNAHDEWVNEAKQTSAEPFRDSITAVREIQNISKSDLATATDRLQRQETTLNTDLGKLGKPQERQLNQADRQLDDLASSASARVVALEGEKSRLTAQLNRMRPKQVKAPTAHAIEQAEADVETKRTAAEEAPEVERDRQAKLRLARENLTAAQDRLIAAQVAQRAAEQTWLGGIEFLGPGADGFVTPTAKLLATPLPTGYSLEWTFDGAPLLPDAQGRIRFDTRKLATGSYAIAVHLHRD